MQIYANYCSVHTNKKIGTVTRHNNSHLISEHLSNTKESSLENTSCGVRSNLWPKRQIHKTRLYQRQLINLSALHSHIQHFTGSCCSVVNNVKFITSNMYSEFRYIAIWLNFPTRRCLVTFFFSYSSVTSIWVPLRATYYDIKEQEDDDNDDLNDKPSQLIIIAFSGDGFSLAIRIQQWRSEWMRLKCIPRCLPRARSSANNCAMTVLSLFPHNQRHRRGNGV